MSNSATRRGTARTIGLVLVTASAAVAAFLAGCGGAELKSVWRSQNIDIGKRSDDLQRALYQIEDKHVMVGFVNDSNYLYVELTTEDQSLQRQVLYRGLTVWFDHTGGNDKRFGIHYPLGGGDMRGGGRDDRDRDGDGGDGAREGGQEWDRPAPDMTEAEIIGPLPEEHHRVRLAELRQVALSMNTSPDGRLEYQMRIPLMDNGAEPYALGAITGGKIGVGFEGAARMQRQPEGGGEGGGYGGVEGGRRGGGGRGGGRRGGGGGYRSPGSQAPEPLNVWLSLILAAPGGAQ